ncbi:unnamed protein product, partial [Owenia fusiformis]
VGYQIGFGTEEGMIDVVPLTNLGHYEYDACVYSFTDMTTLVHNTTYYTILYAFNGGHRQLNVSVISDGGLMSTFASFLKLNQCLDKIPTQPYLIVYILFWEH